MITRRKFFEMAACIPFVAPLATKLEAITPKAPVSMVGITLWDVSGQTVFPMFGQCGAPISCVTCFPMKQIKEGLLVFGYVAKGFDRHGSNYESLPDEAKYHFALALNDSRIPFTPAVEGGEMPKHGEIYLFPYPYAGWKAR